MVLTEEKVYLSLLKAPAVPTARHLLPWQWKTLTIHLNSTLTMVFCKCKLDPERKEAGRGIIFSVESCCCQIKEPRVKVAPEFNLLCSGCRKVQGQKDQSLAKRFSRGKS